MGTARPSTGELAPTTVEDGAIVFRLGDPEHAHERVTVWVDLVRPPEWPGELELQAVDGGWELSVDVPDLDCLEYLFDVDGAMAPDPGNPDQVDGAFGPHSWLAMPGYRAPAWLGLESADGQRTQLSLGEIDVEVWEPTGHEDALLPLLLVHDGAEMDQYGGVVRYAASRAPMRVGLLAPGSNRDERYAANPAYAAALVGEVIPALIGALPTAYEPVLLGQSLGGLAALHAAWLYPDAFSGLVLQSGSFFTPELDPQESDYPHFDHVVGFVASLHESTGAPVGFPPVAFTCGLAEENLANNRLMHTHLADLDVPVSWGEARQGHTWMCWRDTLDPHLGDLLTKVWDV
jgi:enterochelin esterase family protein